MNNFRLQNRGEILITLKILQKGTAETKSNSQFLLKQKAVPHIMQLNLTEVLFISTSLWDLYVCWSYVAALLTAIFERFSEQTRKYLIYQILPVRNLQNGRVEKICDLSFRKPCCRAETCNCHEQQFTLVSDLI